jgi:hypothetical protein
MKEENRISELRKESEKVEEAQQLGWKELGTLSEEIERLQRQIVIRDKLFRGTVWELNVNENNFSFYTQDTKVEQIANVFQMDAHASNTIWKSVGLHKSDWEYYLSGDQQDLVDFITEFGIEIKTVNLDKTIKELSDKLEALNKIRSLIKK